jgi:N-acetyl-alpha-D-glucosaminyl L-malate synthase BshA
MNPLFFPPLKSQRLSQHSLIEGDLFDKSPSYLKTDWLPHEIEGLIALAHKVISQQRLEIFHVHYALPFALIAAELKKRLGASAPLCIVTIHGTDVSIYGRDPGIGPALAEALQSCDGVTAVSKNLAVQAVHFLRLDTKPTVIPNFLLSGRFHAKKACLNKTPRILHVSNLRPVKDPEGVAHIFTAIRRQIDAELWLVGGGNSIASIKRILENNGLANNARYFGLQQDIATILPAADILLMPSISESFCIVALEAMACGIPVLATNVGGLPEVVVHGQTGFLFAPKNYAAAADIAVGLLSQPSLYLTMSRAAKKHASRFDSKRAVSAYEKLYYAIREKGTFR